MGKLNQPLSFLLNASLYLGMGSLLYGKPAAPAPNAPPQASDSGQSTVEASRYVGDDVDKFVQDLLPSMSMAGRTTDPFGRLQDPEAKPIVPTSSIENLNQPAEPQVPFSEIISLIEINTVMSAEKRFLVGSRTFSQGDQFPLNFRGKQIRLQITEVSSRQVQFKNLDTGEVAAHQLNLLPPGMKAGQDGITAPGMVPSGRNAPLEIEPANQVPSGSPTR